MRYYKSTIDTDIDIGNCTSKMIQISWNDVDNVRTAQAKYAIIYDRLRVEKSRRLNDISIDHTYYTESQIMYAE